jgi:uncharacterized protein with PQ loop repeat
MMEIIGWVGLGLLLVAWIPQTMETIRTGCSGVNVLFVTLYVCSSGLLAVYAYLRVDIIFFILNALLTIGSGINLYYKLWPRNR